MNNKSTRRILRKISIFIFLELILLFIEVFFVHANAQTGYLYVQKKALDETSSLRFNFTLSGGSAAIPNFSLSDKNEQVPLQDIGASQSGRLWAVGTDNILYYRDLGSSAWVATSITDAYRVDGGPGNTCYYLRTTNDPYYFDGVTSILLGNWDAFNNNPAFDIGCAWNNQPYITTNEGTIWQYSGTGTTWTQTGTETDNYYIDGNPTNGNAIVTKTDNTIWSITSAGTGTSLGAPAGTGDVLDAAVTSDGSIFAGYNVPDLNSNDFAFKWIGGTTWSSYEITSRHYTNCLTAGLGGQVWGIYAGNGASEVNRNIFTRTYDGTTTLWLNDERVRTSDIGNSIMIPVEPGTYTLTELVPAGWDLQYVKVYDPTNNSSASLTSNKAILEVGAGETVTVLFENGVVNPFPMTNSCTTSYLEDFGSGDIDTYGPPLAGQTSYHYQTSDNTLANNYKITGNADMLFGGAADLKDHTTGDGMGRMIAVDANNEQDAFFRRRFTGIIPGVIYNFSAWIANINAGGTMMPNVTFEVIDPSTYAVLKSLNTGDITSDAVWTQFVLSFTASTTAFDLVIRNNGFGGTGNDLAIDDISFTMLPVSEPIVTVTHTGCGTPGKITVTSPVGAAYEYSKDNFATAAQASPVFPNLTPGNYIISARFVGTINCIAFKADVVGATICGNIWNDANGNAINNSENPIINGVWVNVVDHSTHAVLQSVQTDASGNYSLTGLATNTSYEIILSSASQTGNTNLTTATLPADYTNTGTNLSGASSTVNTSGIITVNTGAGGLIVQNFGIEKLPESHFKTQFVSPPLLGIILAGTVNIPISGKDPEDGILGSGNKIRITDLPSNAIMMYGLIPAVVIAGQQITGFDPALISFIGIIPGSTAVVFNYAFIDAANKQDPTPASYTVTWSPVLPVILESFTATATDCNSIILNWKIADAINFSHFEMERSINGIDFKAIGSVPYTAAIANYNFSEKVFDKGSYQYRLKMIDSDAKIKYSPIIFIRLDCNPQSTLLMYPNPVKEIFTINGLGNGDELTIYNSQGQTVYTNHDTGYQMDIDVRKFRNGVYYIFVTNKKGEKVRESKFVKID